MLQNSYESPLNISICGREMLTMLLAAILAQKKLPVQKELGSDTKIVGDDKKIREFRSQFGALAINDLLKTRKAFYRQKIQWEQT